jgi:hypothetical protein
MEPVMNSLKTGILPLLPSPRDPVRSRCATFIALHIIKKLPVQLLLKLVDCVDDRMRGGAGEDADAGMEPPDRFRWLEYDEEDNHAEDDEHSPNACDEVGEAAEAEEENLTPAAQAQAWHTEHPPHQDQLLPPPEEEPPGGAHQQMHLPNQHQDVGHPAIPANPNIQVHHELNKSAPHP